MNTNKNTDTLLVNEILSSALPLPAVNTAGKYLTNLDHGDIIGGSPQMHKPSRYIVASNASYEQWKP